MNNYLARKLCLAWHRPDNTYQLHITNKYDAEKANWFKKDIHVIVKSAYATSALYDKRFKNERPVFNAMRVLKRKECGGECKNLTREIAQKLIPEIEKLSNQWYQIRRGKC
jgi:hypothetical protein